MSASGLCPWISLNLLWLDNTLTRLFPCSLMKLKHFPLCTARGLTQKPSSRPSARIFSDQKVDECHFFFHNFFIDLLFFQEVVLPALNDRFSIRCSWPQRTYSRLRDYGMKQEKFEQGPIRPPSEAGSLLFRFTRNCPWNRCTFCPLYKGKRFSRRSLEEIKGDIDTAAEIYEEISAFSFSLGYGGSVTREVLESVFTGTGFNDFYRQVARWRYMGKGGVFIQDANSLVLPAPVLVEAIRHLKRKIPGIGRITSYARSSTLAKMSVAELRQIREAGLDRIHVGMESGSDRVLEFVQKGVKAKHQIEAGRKVIEAGMELSEYIMPGLGGKELSEDNARQSASVLNEINPHFIRLRSLRVPSRTPLFQDVRSGHFTPLSDDETVFEIRLFISSLDVVSSRLTSDHVMNLLEEVAGKLPEDKEAMLAAIDRYLGMPDEERLLFRLGRRGGALRSLDDLNDPMMRQRLQSAMRDLTSQTEGDVENVITELGDRYI